MPSKEWERQYQFLKEYYAKHSTWPSPDTTYPANNPLGAWCETQKHRFHDQDLDAAGLLNLLDSAFSFLSDQEKWDIQYSLLVEYLEAHDHAYPNRDTQYPPGNFLGRWCHFQKLHHQNGELSDTRKEKLAQIQFPLGTT